MRRKGQRTAPMPDSVWAVISRMPRGSHSLYRDDGVEAESPRVRGHQQSRPQVKESHAGLSWAQFGKPAFKPVGAGWCAATSRRYRASFCGARGWDSTPDNRRTFVRLAAPSIPQAGMLRQFGSAHFSGIATSNLRVAGDTNGVGHQIERDALAGQRWETGAIAQVEVAVRIGPSGRGQESVPMGTVPA